PRTCEAGDESVPNRITSARHHNRDRVRGMLGSADSGSAHSHNHIHLEPDQLGREVGEPLLTPLRRAVLNDEVLALDIPEVAQFLPEGLQVGLGSRETGTGIEPTNPGDFPCWLRRGGKDHGEETQSQGDETPHRAAPHETFLLCCWLLCCLTTCTS